MNEKEQMVAIAAHETAKLAKQREELVTLLKSATSKKLEVLPKVGLLEGKFIASEYRGQRPERPTPEEFPPLPQRNLVSKIFGRESSLLAQHSKMCLEIQKRNEKAQEGYRMQLKEWESAKADFITKQNARKQKYFEQVEKRNTSKMLEREAIETQWKKGVPETVLHVASLAIKGAYWPEPLKPRVETFYKRDTKTFLVDMTLPHPDEMPTVKTYRYAPSTGEIKETHISKAEIRKNYETMCYQVCLRTINDLIRSDIPRNIEHLAFNGRVIGNSKATGQRTESVILSLITSREEFKKVTLRKVDAKECFKSLRGISASQLFETVAIAPVLSFDQLDDRFIEPRGVTVATDGSTNLAELDWNDFEHLIREVFESEFRSRGGEVKVTQSSSDGGVDAVAFDPDPISGGKIVIQAKRYTRTVDVSAVRDLYGTTQSEGAIKGILVTTSDYGPDAYKFAQNKPISLLNGANLLHLLEKHGHKATIDIAQARRNLGLSSKNERTKR